MSKRTKLQLPNIELVHILMFGLLVFGGVFVVWQPQSISEYNEFCENEPYSVYCVCGTTSALGDYSVIELGGESKRFHGDVWIQTHLDDARIVSCMRGRIQIDAECSYGVIPTSTGGYECVPAPAQESEDLGFILFLIGFFVVLMGIILIVLRFV